VLKGTFEVEHMAAAVIYIMTLAVMVLIVTGNLIQSDVISDYGEGKIAVASYAHRARHCLGGAVIDETFLTDNEQMILTTLCDLPKGRVVVIDKMGTEGKTTWSFGSAGLLNEQYTIPTAIKRGTEVHVGEIIVQI